MKIHSKKKEADSMDYIYLPLAMTFVGAVALIFLAALGVFEKEKER
jgi:hypothetical protein